MKAILLVGAAALALTPAIASAQTAPGNGQNNGNGYWHLNSGNAGSAPGGGSPFTGEDSKAGQKYAGSQPQNSRNTASVSQYDVACANQLK